MQRICLLVDSLAGSRNSKLITSSPVLGMYIQHSAHCSHTRSHYKDAALREHCVTETIWTVYMIEPR